MAFWNRKKEEEPEKRSNKDWFLSFQDAVYADATHAGMRVTEESSTCLPAVYRCVSLNADTVSSMPVDVLTKKGKKVMPYTEPVWFQRPNAEQDFGAFISQAQASLELDGNAFILKVSSRSGRLVGLHVLAPSAVDVDRPVDTGRRVYKVRTADGGEQLYADTAILHIQGFTLPGGLRGLSPIYCAKQAVGLGLAAEQFGAQYFGSGATLSGIISMAGAPGQESVDALKEQFVKKHGGISQSHAIGILTGGAIWTPLSVTPEESQFLETRRFTDVQIASIFGVPPEYVTEVEGAKGFVSGLYARQYMWLLTGINSRLVRLERAFSGLLPPAAYFKWNRNSFLAMDPQDRREFYAAGLRDRWLVPNEVREKEDMNPLPNGDEPLLSVQWQDAAAGIAAPPDAFEPPQGQKDEGSQQ